MNFEKLAEGLVAFRKEAKKIERGTGKIHDVKINTSGTRKAYPLMRRPEVLKALKAALGGAVLLGTGVGLGALAARSRKKDKRNG